ncbi:MAG: hypothetical protein DMF98_15975 [Acidobacteria bacterium]|nr:MAG: hypothetical protein DMF98_15975 [Acidobacteriota bacterium]
MDEFTRAFDEALRAAGLTTLVGKVEVVGPPRYVTDRSLLENRFEFQRYLTRGIHARATR